MGIKEAVLPMRVAFGIGSLGRKNEVIGIDGIGQYAHHLSRRLACDEEIDLCYYSFNGVDEARAATSGGPFLRQALQSLVLGRQFPVLSEGLKDHCDVLHSPDHLIPKLKTTPVVATIMDVIPLSNPEWVGYSFRSIKNGAWKRSIKWASRIITVSQFSKHQIMEYLQIPESKIDVIPLGIDEEWFVAPKEEVASTVLNKYSLPRNYFLFLGTLQPRKNVHRLVAAHRALPAESRKAFPLVLVGRYGWGEAELLGELNQLQDRTIVWLKYLSRKDLHVILSSATALVFPSLKEGFGLPLVEAMAAGTPLIASASSSIPEVVGDAAIMVEPTSVCSIASGMTELIDRPEVGKQNVEIGKKRARLFSWDTTARMTIDSYRNALW